MRLYTVDQHGPAIPAQLLDDERNNAYYKHAVPSAITNLSHLYFRFAVLAETVLGPRS